MNEPLTFFVTGQPAPAGSKKFVGMRKTGGAMLIDMAGKGGKSWRKTLQTVAVIQRPGVGITYPNRETALYLFLVFYQSRPKCHYGTGRNRQALRATAKRYPTTAPDTTKLFRAVEDALTGIIYADDAQIVHQGARKLYCDETHPQPGCLIMIQQETT